MEDWTPDEAKWKVICQRCGRMGSIDNNKANPWWHLHEFEMTPVTQGGPLIVVEYHLCEPCEREVYPE